MLGSRRTVTFNPATSKYSVLFAGKTIETVVTDKASVIDSWLCIDCKCLIVQLFYVDYIPDSLKNFLMDPNFTFVGIEVGDDIAKLRDEYGLNCRKHADVREAAKNKWPGRFRRPGLKDLAVEVAGLHMKKPRHVVMSNWEARNLNDSQVEYACVDAYASYKIGHKLLIEN
ncbi:hypothetical protein CRG98_011289 [Punica granatum]|uniref:3'-5' exonuclease domain-containing protein n=1 Tax=Punica granatum TaxID=22663 RepID=A0A2I0KIG3_PUNGR|nr:hypothetical protein CRG98_011289 [Punica granatum]